MSPAQPSAAAPETPPPGSVTLFTTSWCGYCRRLKGTLTREGIPFVERDIEAEPELADVVEEANGGNRTVPTVLFPDGSTLTNPPWVAVRDRLAELDAGTHATDTDTETQAD